MTIVLHQFAYSHFNEKVRWALDYKQVPHIRKIYLPGPHMPAIRKISGQTQTPVLQIDDRYIAGSAQIIDVLEKEYDGHRLYPDDRDLCAEALQTQAWLDARAGPAVRTVLFSELIKHGSYLCNMFAHSKPWLKRVAYRLTFPLARPLIARGNKIVDPGNVADAFRIVDDTLDKIAARVEINGCLVGTEFSVADVAAGALIAPLADVSHPDMAKPKPMPETIAQLLARYADHAAIQWVCEVYRTRR